MQDPWSAGGAVSRDGTIGYATVALDDGDDPLPAEDLTRLLDTVREAGGDGLVTAVGGEAARGAEEAGGGAAEGAGMLAALVDPGPAFRLAGRGRASPWSPPSSRSAARSG